MSFFEILIRKPGEKLDIIVERGEMFVEGKQYEKLVKPPSLRDILWPTAEKRKERLKLDLTRGNPIKVDGQVFLGYTSAVRSIEEVNELYSKIRSFHTDAQHILCSFRLPHREFHTHQDFEDDGEHNGGAFLLQLMMDSGIRNRVLFVVRIYDGTHIGSKRYDAMKDATKSALAAANKNPYTGNYDTLWEQSAGTNPNTPIRGRGGHYYSNQKQLPQALNIPAAWKQPDPLSAEAGADAQAETQPVGEHIMAETAPS